VPRRRPLEYRVFSIRSLLSQVKLVPAHAGGTGNAVPDGAMGLTRGEATLAVTTPIIARSLHYFGVIGQAFFPILSI